MIVFDIQAVQSIAHGERGIARYTGELAKALQQNHPDLVDVFAYNDAMPYAPRLDRLGLEGKLVPFSELRGVHVDLLHVNSPFEQPNIHLLQTPVVADRTVVTCYDLIPYRFSDIYLPDVGAKAWYQSRLGLLVAADAIVTDSESAAHDVVDMLGVDARTVTSIGAGTSEEFIPPTDSLADRMAELRKVAPDLLPGFVLVPAGPEWRKNLDGAIEAYSRLAPEIQERHQLVVASKIAEGQRAAFFEHCAELGITDKVVVTGFVSDEDLVRLYQSCELVLFPSKYEGFGLPVLEARRCGARVITSRVSSLPEVMPEPAALFNPYDIDEMAARLEAALTDDEVIARLDAAADPGFTWDLAADRLAAVYRSVRSRPLPPEPQRRPRLALMAPVEADDAAAPQRTMDLIEAVSEANDVTLFVHEDAARITAQWGISADNVRMLPARDAAGEFDLVVYALGDRRLEQAAASVVPLVPGAFVLWAGDNVHDVSDDARSLLAYPGPMLADGSSGIAAIAESIEAAIGQRVGNGA